MMKTTKGFTLAEVLTTLMVIGVVAALTIPTLIGSTSEQTAKARVKKAMSTLSQATLMLAADSSMCSFTYSAAEAGKEAVNVDAGQLAACFNQVMSGTITGTDDDVIQTADGMRYKFILPRENLQASSISSLCGDAQPNPMAIGNCSVLVDVDGSAGDGFPSSNNYSESSGWSKTPESGYELYGFALTAKGVAPVAIAGASNNASKYINGANATGTAYNCYRSNSATQCKTGGGYDTSGTCGWDMESPGSTYEKIDANLLNPGCARTIKSN